MAVRSCHALVLTVLIAADGLPFEGVVYPTRKASGMVTWDALTCLFTFGLLIVAMFTFNDKSKKK